MLLGACAAGFCVLVAFLELVSLLSQVDIEVQNYDEFDALIRPR